MLEHVSRLQRDIDAIRGDLERMLADYGLLVDYDMAKVLHSYVRALHLDVERALTRGHGHALVPILEDLREVHSDAERRLTAVKARYRQWPVES